MSKNTKLNKPYLIGTLLGLVTVSLASLASVPRSNLGQETAAYPELTEIRGRKVGRLSFDGEIASLSAAEARFHEKLPSVRRAQAVRRAQPMPARVGKPAQRVSSAKYRRSR